jgi:hypothetical protein
VSISSVSPTTRENVTSVIRTAATATGGDFGYLLRQAQIESGLNPTAKAASSSAFGLFQFTADTWIQMIRKHGAAHGLAAEAQAIESGTLSASGRLQLLGLRSDPELATRMAAEFAADNARFLAASGHGALGPTELYLAHFLGPAGATKFLDGLKTTPDAAAAKVLPQAADANEAIFFPGHRAASFREIYQRFANRFEGVGDGSPAIREIAQSASRALSASTAGPPKQTYQSTADASSSSRPVTSAPASAAPTWSVDANAMSQFLVATSHWDDGTRLKPLTGSSGERDASLAARTNGV